VYNLFVYIYVFLCFVFRLCRLSDFLFYLSYTTSFMLQNFMLMDVLHTAMHLAIERHILSGLYIMFTGIQIVIDVCIHNTESINN